MARSESKSSIRSNSVDFSRLNNPSVEGLTQRLEDGYRRIDEAQRNGADTSVWEEFWLKLLHEYEMLCDELDHAA